MGSIIPRTEMNACNQIIFIGRNIRIICILRLRIDLVWHPGMNIIIANTFFFNFRIKEIYQVSFLLPFAIVKGNLF